MYARPKNQHARAKPANEELRTASTNLRTAPRPGGLDATRRIRPEHSGTSERAWDHRLSGISPATVPGSAVVVVAPHPDDEVLGAGGLIAASVRGGRRVDVVICTDGEAAYPHPDLAAVRRQESEAALGRLAGDWATLHRLGLPDGRLVHHECDLVSSLRQILPAGATVIAPWPADGHPDHQAVGLACARATGDDAPLLWYPVWAWHWAHPTVFDGHHLIKFPLDSRSLQAKHEALLCYKSQRSGALGPPILTPEVLVHFDRPYEIFIEPT